MCTKPSDRPISKTDLLSCILYRLCCHKSSQNALLPQTGPEENFSGDKTVINISELIQYLDYLPLLTKVPKMLFS